MVDPQGQVLSVLQAIHQHNNIEGRPKGIRQILLSEFFPLRGYPPPPLTEKRRKFLPYNGPKRAKNRDFGPKIPVF